MPPSSTPPLRDPANSRSAECASRCQGEESAAQALVASDAASILAVSPRTERMGAARMGTIAVMKRLYRLELSQTIELLVMYCGKLD
jgi:hypothetical protein